MALHDRFRVDRIAAAVLLLVLAAGCGADSATTVSDPEPLDEPSTPAATTSEQPLGTPDPDDLLADGRTETAMESLTGIVGGDPGLEGGCLWVEVDGTRYQLVPADTSGLVVDGSALQILDASGDVIAGAGDEVIMTGTVDADAMSFCQVGPIFTAIDVGATG